jgi:hypothetical protein
MYIAVDLYINELNENLQSIVIAARKYILKARFCRGQNLYATISLYLNLKTEKLQLL